MAKMTKPPEPIEPRRDYSGYSLSELLESYKLLEIAELGLPLKDFDRIDKIITQRMQAISEEIAKRVIRSL